MLLVSSDIPRETFFFFELEERKEIYKKIMTTRERVSNIDLLRPENNV